VIDRVVVVSLSVSSVVSLWCHRASSATQTNRPLSSAALSKPQGGGRWVDEMMFVVCLFSETVSE
jgi:hypothetical protein